MEFRPLGRSGLTVSAVSLGTMTFGQQNDESEAHALMDLAADHGVNFLDAAELYPITPTAETQGRTEDAIGTWMKARGNRDKMVVASKVVARSPGMPWFRGPDHCLDAANIQAALETSLRRLQTDVIDLYYLHWPERRTNYFGQRGYTHHPDDSVTPLEDSLQALDDAVKAGKIRHIGISNETPWGLHRFLTLAEERGWPRVAAIQNPYSLVNRLFEVGLAEMAIREEVPLVAYSPLAGGVLSGKYAKGARPEGSRIALWPERYNRYMKPRAQQAAELYINLARRHGLAPTAMALAYVMSRPFCASAIVGATSAEQLKTNLQAVDLTLPADLLEDIDLIQETLPNPAP